VNLDYSWSVEGAAYYYLSGLSKRRRKQLERAIEALALHPFQPSLFTLQDDDGLPLAVVENEGHLISYHADHATQSIRVTEITPLP